MRRRRKKKSRGKEGCGEERRGEGGGGEVTRRRISFLAFGMAPPSLQSCSSDPSDTSPLEAEPFYTLWYSMDTPIDGKDIEKLSSVLDQHNSAVCRDPVSAECRVRVSQVPADQSGLVFRKDCTDATVGLKCVNVDQPSGTTCPDFEIRFMCPSPTGALPRPNLFWDFSGRTNEFDPEPVDCSGRQKVTTSIFSNVPDTPDGTLNSPYSVMILEDAPSAAKHKCALRTEYTAQLNMSNFAGHCLADTTCLYVNGRVMEQIAPPNLFAITSSYQHRNDLLLFTKTLTMPGYAADEAPDMTVSDLKIFYSRFDAAEVAQLYMEETGQRSYHWTSWFDVDSPDDGVEYEDIALLLQESCAHPKDIACRVKYTGVTSEAAGQTLRKACTLTDGLQCMGTFEGVADNPNCFDYEIKLLCPHERIYWSNWFNADSPDDPGDEETFDLHQTLNDPSLCPEPLFAECRVVESWEPWYVVDANLSYPYTCTPDGLVCLNGIDADCSNFEVRYACPYSKVLKPVEYWDLSGRSSTSEQDPVDCGNHTNDVVISNTGRAPGRPTLCRRYGTICGSNRSP
ncbi:uncharacterized protein [Diadema antillarum]|uniref:uncharacterized protein n=1 Tax=Diadema antillarum TaxID=105358 RepID=UPI003A897675